MINNIFCCCIRRNKTKFNNKSNKNSKIIPMKKRISSMKLLLPTIEESNLENINNNIENDNIENDENDSIISINNSNNSNSDYDLCETD